MVLTRTGPSISNNVPDKQIALIDASLPDWQSLVAGLPVDMAVQTFTSLAQLAQWASGHAGEYAALHLFSHGATGVLQLGTDTITQASLTSAVVQAELAELGHSLKAGGDLLLYGCDVAEGQIGANFIGKLAQITHADVAASNNLTGNSALGGNWVLEAATGSVETQAMTIADYQSTLLVVNVNFESNLSAAGGTLAGGATSITQTINGYTFTVTPTSMLVYGTNEAIPGWSLVGSDSISTDYAETGLTFTINGPNKFDLSSLTIANQGVNETFVLTSGATSVTKLIGIAVDTFSVSNSAFTSISSFTLTAQSGTFNILLDEIKLTNVQPVATGPTTTVTTASLSADNGSSATDWLTNTAAQTISGTLSSVLVTGESVQVSYNNGTNWNTATSSVGSTSWSATTTLAAGSGTFQARVINASGNGTAYSHAYTLDTNVATPTLALSSDTGSSNSDGKTSNAQINVSGLESGATWQYSTNGGTNWTTGTGTNFTLTGDGAKSAIARQTDVAGNVSANSSVKTFTLDATAPTTTITANNLNAPTGSDFSFTVQYADSGSGWDNDTFDLGNVTITGPGSVGVLTVTSGSFDGITGLATYTVEAPHSGSWNFGTDAGTYTIAINGNSFKDLAGNAVAAASPAKTFVVSFGLSNAAPTNIALSGNSVAENTSTASALTIGALTSTDPDTGNTFSYSLVGGANQANFQISGGNNLQFKAATVLNYEAKSSYAVTVRTTDQGGLTYDKALTILLTNVNEVPTAANFTSSGLNATTAIANASAGTLVAVDPDAGDTHTFSLVAGNGTNDADNSKFTVVGNTLKVGVTPLTAGTYHLLTRTTDAGGLTFDQAQTITIGTINAAPTNITLSANTVAENTATTSALTIGALTSTDPDTGNTFTYSIFGGADQASFQISGVNLQFKAGTTLDYETKNSYAVTVRTTDQGGLTYDKALTISLSDVNEAPAPVINSTPTPPANAKPVLTASASQNVMQATATALSGISIADPDAGNSPITLTLSTATGTLSARNGDGVTVTYSDTHSITLTGTQTDLNSFISTSQVSYTSAVGTTGSVTLTIVSNDGGHSGSGGAQTDSKTEILNLVLPNVAPVFTSGITGRVAENAPTSTVVYTALATDANLGQTLSYSLSGTDTAVFSLNSNTGSLTLNTSANYEVQKLYNLNIIATDNGLGTLSATQAVTITVLDVNEAPTAISLRNITTSLPENTSTARALQVADIAITDDALGTNTLTLTGTDAADFELIGSGLWLKAGTSLDFKTQTSYFLNLLLQDPSLPDSVPIQTPFNLNLSKVFEVNQSPISLTLPNLTPVPVQAVPTDNSPSDKDGDGSPESLEDKVSALNVIGSVAGDGNGDGLADSLQNSVTSIEFLKTFTAESAPGAAPLTFITLVSDALAGKPDTTDANTAQLKNVRQKDAPAHLPNDMKMPLGLISFETLVSQKGQNETFSLYVNSEWSVNGFWQQNAIGTWVNLASAPYGGQIVNEGGKLRLDFQITDGGVWDTDGQINGVIASLGAMASMPLSLAGQTPVVAGQALWF